MIETANKPMSALAAGPLSNYNDIDRCMSETAHFDEMSSFMSLFDEDGSGRVISPTDSYDNSGGAGVGSGMPPLLGASSRYMEHN